MVRELEVERWLSSQSVCVTGAGGRLGQELARHLLRYGVGRLIGLDRIIPDGGLPGFQLVRTDLLQAGELEQAVRGCTLVFHLAALTAAGPSWEEPFQYFEVNAHATTLLLEACRKAGVSRVVYTSTAHVYGRPRVTPVNEEHPTAPLSPYAASKLAGEVAMEGYAAGELSTCVARISNIYGSGYGDETVVGRAVRQVSEGQPITLRDLKPIRDFIFVQDVAEALIRLAATKGSVAFQVVNVSTGKGTAVAAMVTLLAEVARREGFSCSVGENGEDGDGTEGGVDELVLDNTRLRELTGWEPKVSLQEGLKLSLQHKMERYPRH